jgi:hypothetical protein
MAGILEFLKKAKEDYSQLIEKGAPLNNQYQQLKSNISQNVPPTSAYRDPRQMQEWATAAALNAPIIGAVRKPMDTLDDSQIMKEFHSYFNTNLPLEEAYKLRQTPEFIDLKQKAYAIMDKNKKLGKSKILAENEVDPKSIEYGTGPGYDANRVTPKEFKHMAPNMSEEAKAAHIVRSYGIIPNDTNEVYFGPNGPSSILDAFNNNMALDKSKFNIGSKAYPKLLESSKVKLARPMYIRRDEGFSNFNSNAKNTEPPNFLVSGSVIDPRVKSQYNNNYSRSADTNVPSFIYKLEPGSEVYHPGNLADPNEVIATRELLNKSKHMSRREYLKHVAKGAAPFAISGLGIQQMVNQKDKK